MSHNIWNQQQKVYYDGYQLPVATISMAAKSEYDSSGHILNGYVLTFKMGLLVTETSANLLANRITNLLSILARPRRDFWWQFDGENFFRVNPATTESGLGVPDATQSRFRHFYYDRRYGPKPRVASVDKHIGGKSARITVEIECFVNTCPGDVVSDFEEAWWEFSYSFDVNFSCTRTINGTYRLRSPLNAGLLLPTGGYFPSLPQNFQRDRWDHKLSKDGLTLSFTVTDKQRWRTLPRPITDGSAIFSISQTGGTLKKNLTASFEAPNNVNKRVIVQFCMALVATKFPGMFTGKEAVNEFKLSNDEFNNKVSLSVTTTTASAKLIKNTGTETEPKLESTIAGLRDLGWFDVKDLVPKDNDEWQQVDGWSSISPMTGTAGLIPIAQQPFQMCQEGATVPDDAWNPNATTPALTGPTGGTGSGSVGSNPGGNGDTDTPVESIFTDEHTAAPYETFEEVILYRLNTGIVTIPTSGGGDAITQQVHAPYVTIVQSGTASRYRKPVEIPAPAFAGTETSGHLSAKLIKKDFTVCAPTFIGDGETPFHRASWAYTIEVPQANSLNNVGSASEDDSSVDVLIPPNVIIDYNNVTVRTNLTNYAGALQLNGDYGSDGSYIPTPYPR